MTSPWKWFSWDEIEGHRLMGGFVDRLDTMRELATHYAEQAGYSGVLGRMVINSGYREGDDGCHGKRLAADIKCETSRARYFLLKAAFAVGFTRIGIYNLHLHIDICEGEGFPQHVAWEGDSS